MNLKDTANVIVNTYRNFGEDKNHDLSKGIRLCSAIMLFQKCYDQTTNQSQMRMVIQIASKAKVVVYQV
jgi:hypothetical protein